MSLHGWIAEQGQIKNGKVSKITENDKNNQDMKSHNCRHPEKDMVHKRKPYQS